MQAHLGSCVVNRKRSNEVQLLGLLAVCRSRGAQQHFPPSGALDGLPSLLVAVLVVPPNPKVEERILELEIELLFDGPPDRAEMGVYRRILGGLRPNVHTIVVHLVTDLLLLVPSGDKLAPASYLGNEVLDGHSSPVLLDLPSRLTSGPRGLERVGAV